MENDWFATTRWSVVLAASSDWTPTAREALEQLCRTYWKPLCTYVRRRGFSPEDADDLTQQFFARFIEKKHYRLADRDRGRFRSFLLAAMKNFLVNEWERVHAQKRGGGLSPVSLDEPDKDGLRAFRDPIDERTADRAFELNWAMTLLAQVRDRLHEHYAAEGRAELLSRIEGFLPGEGTKETYGEVAARVGVPEGTLKSDVHRLKQRYREILRQEIAHTVATPDAIDRELRYLISIVSSTAAVG